MFLLLHTAREAGSCSIRADLSNGCAVSRTVLAPVFGRGALVLCFLMLTVLCRSGAAQDRAQPEPVKVSSNGKRLALFLTGAATGLGAHEAGHVTASLLFGEKPGVRKVDFHGIPFFAITHRSGLPPRREFTISSAGFWVQHVEDEWLLSRRPALRDRSAPFAKGMLAFNVLTSVAYAGAAFAKTGPLERDTRGIAASTRVDERWIGALVLAPAVLDAWRYYHRDAKWAAWTSRGVKIGMVLLVVR
jgi:hypothetical protein